MSREVFHDHIDALFAALEEAWAAAEPPVEWDAQEGVLVVTLPKGEQMILSRQEAMQEVWLASPTGAYHFRMTPEGWVTRQGERLDDVLRQNLTSS